MAFSYENIVNGLQIVAKSASASTTLGDLEVLNTTNKISFHNGTSASSLVTESHTATLTNKSLDFSANTATNIPDIALVVPYIKADGTRALSGNWNAGAFTITANSVQLGSAANQITGLSTIINTGTLTLPTSTDTLVGRATSDTLTNKSLDFSANTATNIPDSALVVSYIKADGSRAFTGAILATQISTPSNPSSGQNKFYTKNDNVLYILNSSGVETPVGSGGYTTTSISTVSAGGTITLGSGKSQYIPVAGNAAAVSTSSTPFNTSPPADGTVITVEGTDDDYTVTINTNDSSNGFVGNGNITLAKYNTLTVVYRSAIGRYIEIARS